MISHDHCELSYSVLASSKNSSSKPGNISDECVTPSSLGERIKCFLFGFLGRPLLSRKVRSN